MPDKRSHRGPHPEDHALFAPQHIPALQAATHDVSWLLTRGYTVQSAVTLAGNHHQLHDRQRKAVMRCACSDESLRSRLSHRVRPEQVGGKRIVVDGYNILTTVESALGGGVLLLARDGCIRDLASMHGHYKRVAETTPALLLIGQTLAQFGPSDVTFLLDAPVSNSGRLKTIMQQLAAANAWPWAIQLVLNPDPILSASRDIIVTADSAILDASQLPPNSPPPYTLNLAPLVLHFHLPQVIPVPLYPPAAPT